MGIKLNRNKKRNYLVSFAYRIKNLLFFLSPEKKLSLFLNLEWVFDRLAHEESYNIYNPISHPFRSHSIGLINKHINENDVVLDIGCKYGELSSEIAKKAKSLTAVDYDVKAIEVAKKNYSKIKNLRFLNIDAFDLLKNENTRYDKMILSHLLEHIDQPKEFLEKCLMYSDALYIEVPDFDKSYNNHYRQKLNLDLIYSDADHVSEFDREELFALLNSLDLKIIDCQFIFGMIKIWCKKDNFSK